MAKIQEEIVLIKLSKLIKSSQEQQSLTDKDFSANLEAIVQQLVGDSIIVEIEKE